MTPRSVVTIGCPALVVPATVAASIGGEDAASGGEDAAGGGEDAAGGGEIWGKGI
jgi:hypothetical protein